jgi:hypothetical protein
MRELTEMIEADRDYHHRQMEMLATHAAWTLAPNAKKGKTIKSTDLYRRPGMTAEMARLPTLKERFDYGRTNGDEN